MYDLGLNDRSHGLKDEVFLLLLQHHFATPRWTLEMSHLIVALLEEGLARLTCADQGWLPVLVICHVHLVHERRVLERQLPPDALRVNLCHRIVEHIRLPQHGQIVHRIHVYLVGPTLPRLLHH